MRLGFLSGFPRTSSAQGFPGLAVAKTPVLRKNQGEERAAAEGSSPFSANKKSPQPFSGQGGGAGGGGVLGG